MSRWLDQSLITPFAGGAANHVTMLLTTYAAAPPLPYSSQHHQNLIFEFTSPHASPATALTHQPVPSIQFRMCCCVTARSLHIVCSCRSSIRNWPLKRSFCNFFCTLNLQQPQILLCRFSLNLYVSFRTHWLAHETDSSKQSDSLCNCHHLFSCPC